MTQRYRSARNAAFHRQGGLCHYCGLSMWLIDQRGYALAYGLTLRQAARLQATAEHLVARQNGGGNGPNIVAACRHCNEYRHKHRPHGAPDADLYRKHVRRQVDRQRWHPLDVVHALHAACTRGAQGRLAG